MWGGGTLGVWSDQGGECTGKSRKPSGLAGDAHGDKVYNK